MSSEFSKKRTRYFLVFLSIFLVTPWYNSAKNAMRRPNLCKIYGCLLITFRLSLVTFGLIDDSFYHLFKNLILSQKVIYIFTMITLTLLNIISIINSSFLDITNWRNLFRNCQYIGKEKGSSFYFAFYVGQFLVLGSSSFGIYVWSLTTGLSLWKTFCVSPILDLYYEFLLVVLWTTFFEKFKSGYSELNQQIVRSTKSVKFVEEMKFLSQDYRILGETIEIFNKLFGYQMMLIIFHSGLLVINSLNFILIIIITHNHHFFYHLVISNMSLFMFALCVFLNVVLRCDGISQEAQKFLDLCYKIQDQFKNDSPEMQSIKTSISYSERFFREINARGFFKINKTIIFSLVGNVASYFVITMQFNENSIGR